MHLENPKDWNSTYYIATFDDCEKYGNHFGTCLTYDVQMMCNSYHADFNFYSGKLNSGVEKLFKNKFTQNSMKLFHFHFKFL